MTNISIHGRHFRGPGFMSGPSAIHVGPTNGPTNVTNIVVVSDKLITCTLPDKDPEWPAIVTIFITTPHGVGSKVGVFHYLPPPVFVVSNSTPTSGPMVGGTAITITGVKLTGVTNVWLDVFGDLLPMTFVIDSDTQITATTPGGGPYIPYGIRVQHATDGVVLYKCNDPIDPAWVFNPPPTLTVTSITPSYSGSLAGMVCEVKGTGFVEIGLVDLSMEALTSIGFVVVDDETATLTMPDAASMFVSPYYGSPAGDTQIYFYQDGGSPVGSFLFQWKSLALISATPVSSPSSGGNTVDLVGLSLDTITLVEVIDDTNTVTHDVTASLIITDHENVSIVMPVLTENATVGRIRIQGIDEGGGFVEGAVTDIFVPVEFTPGAVPDMPIAIVPTSGPAYTYNSVVIEVADSSKVTNARVGESLPLSNFAIVDSTHVSGDAENLPPGVYNVYVWNQFGTGAPLVDAYTYV